MDELAEGAMEEPETTELMLPAIPKSPNLRINQSTIPGLGGRPGTQPAHMIRRPFGPERDVIQSARKNYPNRKGKQLDAFGQPLETPRRAMGLGPGIDRLVKTTSIKLPVSAHTVYLEFHLAHDDVVFTRCFNGVQTVLHLKKWIYEKLWIPRTAYELSYAEAGKAELTDDMRLLTTHESLDTRTLATTRAVHQSRKGATTGVHSVDDQGVTRLYMRLKCRTCGDLLTSLQKCWKYSTFTGYDQQSKATSDPSTPQLQDIDEVDPTLEEHWLKPDPSRHCVFHTRGFEVFEGARGRSTGHAELARIFLSVGKEPYKILQLTRSGMIQKKKVISY
jgi:hypothetical protein